MFHKTTDSGFTLELKNHHKFNIVCFNLSCYTLQKCEVYVDEWSQSIKSIKICHIFYFKNQHSGARVLPNDGPNSMST